MTDKKQQISSVNWSWFGVLAAIVVLTGAATYFVLPALISKTDTDVTIVKAIEGPIKVKPTEPGGKSVDHTDILVVDILKGGTKADDQTEWLRPAAPDPEPPPVSVVENILPKSSTAANKPRSATEEVEKALAESTATEKKANTDILKQTKNMTKNKVIREADKPATKKEEVNKLFAKEKKPVTNSTSKIKKPVTVIEGDAPLYMIQLAAFRSAEKATEMAKILSQKHKTRLKILELETMRVDTGSNGIFHRIVSAPLLRQEADKICGILRRSGQDCFLRKYVKPSR